MPEVATLLLFSAAALLLLVTPGPAVFYIIARSVDQGRWAGIVSVLGISVGTLVHIAAAALGLSAILVSSAVAFRVVQLLGAAYLVYLGIRRFMVPDAAEHTTTRRSPALRRVFWEGVVVNVLNPKTALFFFAFLPQFVDVERGAVATQIVVLGLLLVTLGMLSDGAYALLAGVAGDWLRRHRRFLKAQRYVTGGVYVLLGLVTAIHGATRK